MGEVAIDDRSHAPAPSRGSASRVALSPAPSAGLAGLAPLNTPTVQSRVHETLRSALMRGGFAAGEVLRIQAVAATLDVSTMPVREALARLVSERALEAMPNRSVRVPPITRRRLEDLAGVRSLVEGEALRRAASNLSLADLDALEASIERYDEALAKADGMMPAEAAELNHDFHSRLYAAAGSPTLLGIIDGLWLQSGPYIRAAAKLFDVKGTTSAMHHHRAIVAALRAGDAKAAGEALARDIGHAFSILRGRYPFGEAA